MVATLCLLGCALAGAQPVTPPADGRSTGADWPPSPRLTAGQELVYRGSFVEQAAGGRVQFHRAYRLETRLFVLEVGPRSTEVAVQTVLRDRPAPGASARAVGSARLELFTVDAQGRPAAPAGVNLAVPMEGPPTIEVGAFVPLPRVRVPAGRSWTVPEADRPHWTWRVAGPEAVSGTPCLKLVGVQQTDDWARPRADRESWRRTETVWVATRTGMAEKVERRIERRAPAREEPTHSSTLVYELEPSLQYPGRLAEERKRDILMARQFLETARPFLETPARNGPQLTALLGRINAHLDNQPPTPYREAVLQVRERVEAARRGETPPSLPSEVLTPPGGAAPKEISVGHPAPDFLAPDLASTSQSAALRNWKGRPLLMVFYNPSSRNLSDLARFLSTVSTEQKGVAVVALAMTADQHAANQQRLSLGWKWPVLNGSGLRISYGVECTPRFVLIDAGGTVRAALDGWGPETADEVRSELIRWTRVGP